MLLSVIIPVYNAELYVAACIKSILRQHIEETEYEILLINDGSTDASGKICDDYVNAYHNIRVFHMENGGPSNARNKGIDEARGEYIQFIDADDTIDENLFGQMKNLLKKENTDILVTGAQLVDSQGNKLAKQGANREEIYQKGRIREFLVQLKAEDRHWALYYIWNKWYRRDVIEKNQIRFDTSLRLGEDFIFNCAVFKKAQSISVMGQALYQYYKREVESLTSKVRENELQRRQFVDQAYTELYKTLNIYEIYKSTLAYIKGEMAYISMDSIFYTVHQYSRVEKEEYIKKFMNSEYHDDILIYLRQQQNKIKKIEYAALEKGHYARYIRVKMLYIKIKHL